MAGNYQAAYDAVFAGPENIRQRMAGAITDYALTTVATEGAGVTGHATRLTLASSAVRAARATADQFAMPVAIYCANNSIGNPSDAQLLAAVGAVWNLMAGNV